jgi:glucose/mannose-6-phosphate isomerase
MNLNDVEAFKRNDPENMLDHIDRLPEQLENAWSLGLRLPLPDWHGIQQVVIAGMGGSAIGADLLAAYIEPESQVPVIIHRDYDLPGWAVGEKTLVIASSHSGNTEETISAYSQAIRNGCRTLVVCTGGKLAELARQAGVPLWRFEHTGQPRSAVGFSFGLLLAALSRLSLAPNPSLEVEDALRAMRLQQQSLQAQVPDYHNPAKRMAGQLVNRWVAVIAAEFLAPVARRWKGQIIEVAKTWGQFEFLPEADHNSLAGTINPQATLSNLMAVFLRAPSHHERNRLRIDLTKRTLMLQGIGTDFVDAQGQTRLAQQWTALHFGDYTAYYLAMAYGVDPTPVETIEGFKQEMSLDGRDPRLG